jgi:carbon monoxide dehydrogenase subunit G
MNEFEIVTTIDRPVEAVWAFLQDFTRIPEWNPQITEVRRPIDGPFAVGSTVVYVGKFLGRAFESPSQCTELIANQRRVNKSTGGPFQLEVEDTLQPVEGGTKLTSVYRGESHGFAKLAEPVVVRLAKKQFETAAENMKALLEVDVANAP